MNALDHLKHWIALVADLGSKIETPQDQEAWWLSWTASKNRFQSKLANPNAGSPHTGFPWFKALKYFARITAQILWAKFKLKSTRDYLESISRSGREVYLIKSFAYPSSFYRLSDSRHSFNDPYFADLGSKITKQTGWPVLTWVDPIGSFRFLIQRFSEHPELVPWQAMIHLSDLPGIAKKWLSLSFRSLDADLPQDVRAAIQHDLRALDTAHALCLALAAKRLVTQLKVSHLLMTHENNPWERACIREIRANSPKTQILGFNHSVIPLASANLFPGPGEIARAPMPDRLLCIGPEAVEILKNYGSYGQFPIQPACGLRFESLHRRELKADAPPQTLMIALEGVPEAIDMAVEICTLMRSIPGWKTVLRTHPALRYTSFAHRIPKELLDAARVEISETNSLEKDLQRAGAIVYWGSMVALEGLMLGVPAIHWDRGELLNYDPLFRCSAMKWTFLSGSGVESFKVILDAIQSMEPSGLQAQRQTARKYIQSYLAPNSDEAISRFFSK